MIKILEQLNSKIDVKWIIIAILVLIVLKGCFHKDKLPVIDNSVLTTRVDSLRSAIVVLQAASKSAHDSIKLNKGTIKILYKTKTKDSLIIADMTINDKVNYFKNYVDSYSPIPDGNDTVTIDGSYIQGAINIFLDHNVKIKEIDLLERNAKSMDLIEGRYIKQLALTNTECDTKLSIKQSDIDILNKQVKVYRRQLIYYKVGSILVVVGIILIAI